MQSINASALSLNSSDPARMLLNPFTPVIECPIPESCLIEQVIVPKRLASRFLGSGSVSSSLSRRMQSAVNVSNDETTTLYLSRCLEGHGGPLCAVCEEGWAEKSRGSVCVRCEEGEAVLRGLGITGLTIAVLLFLLHSLRSALNESLRTVKVHLETAVLRVQTRERKMRRQSATVLAIHQLVS